MSLTAGQYLIFPNIHSLFLGICQLWTTLCSKLVGGTNATGHSLRPVLTGLQEKCKTQIIYAKFMYACWSKGGEYLYVAPPLSPPPSPP